MPMPENAAKGQVVATDATFQERRDAARRRLGTALTEIGERAQPKNIVKNNPVAVAVVAGGIGILVAKGFVRPRRIVYRDAPGVTGAQGSAGRSNGAPNLRGIIFGTLTSVVLNVLKDRFLEPTLRNALKPNLERMADSATERFGRKEPPTRARP